MRSPPNGVPVYRPDIYAADDRVLAKLAVDAKLEAQIAKALELVGVD